MQHGCAAFWNHTNIRPGNRVFPCCRFKHAVGEFTGDLDAVLDLPVYHRLREQSRSDQPIDGCQKCYQEESVGIPSLREKFNSEYDTQDVSLQWLEIGFDNVCNLACDGCGPEFSSTWAQKLGAIPIKPSIVDHTISKVPDTIRKVLFLGGEPLMTNQHEKFLKQIDIPSKVEIIYNTNGSFMLSQSLTNLLMNFSKVSFIVSVDGYQDLNAQVRSGSDWNQILRFIDQVSANFNLIIHTTLHQNNWHGLVDLCEWITSNHFTWTLNCLSYPAHLDVIYLDSKDKNNLIQILQDDRIPNHKQIALRLKRSEQQNANQYL